MDKDNGTGLQISALMRNYLSLHSNLSWKEITIIGEKINTQIEEATWLYTDKGLMFENTFIPERIINNE